MSELASHGTVAFTRLSIDSTLEVLDDKGTTFRSEHIETVRAMVPSRFFVCTYTWTGTDHNDYSEVVCDHDMWGQPLHRIHGRVIREDTTRIVVVDLGRTLQIGESDTIHVRRHLRDLGRTFEPLLGHYAKPGNQLIRLSVVLPSPLSTKVTYRESAEDTKKDVVVERLDGVPLDNERIKFERVITAPAQSNRNFRLCWGRLA